MKTFRLSQAQARLIPTELSNPGTTAYIIPISMEFSPGDEPYIRDAIESLLQGNINIRFTRDDNLDVVQYLGAPDLSTLSYMEAEGPEVEAAVRAFVSTGFSSIFDRPLYRFGLIKASDKLVLVVVLHHLIGDGTSTYSMADRLRKAVAGLKSGLKNPVIETGYYIYTKLEEQYLNSPESQKDKEYWVDQLGDLSDFGQVIPVGEDLSIGTIIVDLPDKLTGGISQVCARCSTSISPFVLVSTLAAVYFSRVNQSKGTVLSSGYSGRGSGDDFKNIMGMFVNPLPLKYSYHPQMPFINALEESKQILKDGLSHGRYPVNLYAGELKQQGTRVGLLLNYSIVSNAWKNAEFSFVELGHGEFPILIRTNPALDDRDGLQRLIIEYRLDCFTCEKIETLVDALLSMLEDIINRPAIACGEINITGQAEKSLIAGGLASVQNSFAGQEAEKYYEKVFAGRELDSNLTPDQPGERNEPVTASYYLRCSLPSDETVLIGAFAYTLAKYTNQEEVIFWKIADGKSFPVYVNINEEQTAFEYLQQLENDLSRARKYAFYPLKELINIFSLSSDVQLVCGGTNDDWPFKFQLSVSDSGISAQYNSSLYYRETIERFTGSMQAAAAALAEGCRLSEIEIVSQKDLELLKAFNDNSFPVNRELTIVDMLRAQAAKTPDNTAVVYAERAYSYRELDEITDRIARFLTSKGVGREQAVGVLIKRSELIAICSIAVLKSGAAYLPLDPGYPSERLEFMLVDAGAQILFVDDVLYDKVPNYRGEMIPTNRMGDLDADVWLEPPKAEDLFILLYTSGSTGLPKGCMLEHRNLVNFCLWFQDYYRVTEADRGAAYASYGFDACMMDLYPFLTRGAAVYVIPEEMRLDLLELNNYFEKNHITIAFMTTQLGRQFAMTMENKSLRHLSAGGEKLVPCPPPVFNFHNLYGPTECTILTSAFLMDREYASVPIGKPLYNTDLYILDKQGRQLPVGVPGELCISGYQVARGYLNRPELTVEKFVFNPYNQAKGYERCYKTGDVCRWLPDGNMEFIGRRDFQVKIRGFRVELTEIECKIREYQGITDATVIAYDDAGGGKYVAAYVVADHKVNVRDLNDFVAQDLPDYMVPVVTMQLNAIPLNQNGKVNKRALPEPKLITEEVVLPRNEMQNRIFDCIRTVIGSDAFGINTDIFRAGLTSIGAVKLNVVLSREFSIDIKSGDLKENNTVEKLEKFIVGGSSEARVYEKLSEYPLTQTQLGIYLECLRDEKSTVYNIPMLFKLGDGVDASRLAAAIEAAIDAHPYMKCFLKIDANGDVKQVRNDELSYEVKIITTTAGDFEDSKASLVQPFDLNTAPLFRFAVIKTEAGQYLFMDIHHIISDGSSVAVLFEDINRAYSGAALVSEDYTSFDLSLEEIGLRAGREYADAKAYFDSIFKGLEIDSLPFADLSCETGKGGTWERVEELSIEAIEALCSRIRISPNALFTGAFAYLLGQYSGQDEALFTTVYNGRMNPKTERIMGMLVKTLPVYARLDDEQKVPEYLSAIKQHLLELMANDIYSFGEISHAYGIKADILFVYQGDDFTDFEIGGEASRQLYWEVEDPKAALVMQVFVEGGKYRFICEYRSDRYSENMIAGFTGAYIEAVKSFIKAETLADVAITSESSLALLNSLNDNSFPVDREMTIVDMLRAQAARKPDDIAVVFSEKVYTYRELDEITDRIARLLTSKGAGREQAVGVLIKRSELIAIASIGVLKSGAAYLPLDPNYPSERLEFMLGDAGAKILIIDDDLYDKVPNYQGELIPTGSIRGLEDIDIELKPPQAGDLFILLYTSGSTGTPKGCMLEHRNLVNFCLWFQDYYGVIEADRGAAYASYGFDACMMDLYPFLTRGAAVHIIPEEMRLDLLELNRYFENNGISIAFMTTQLGRQFAISMENHSLRHLSVGGEKLVPCAPTQFKFHNLYGPTECTILTTAFLMDREYASVPIGRPLFNTDLYILDKQGRLMPVGAPGELCIAGYQVSRGYLNRPELTAEKFVFNPYNHAEGYDHYYKTGDVCRWLPDGNIEFIGRRDFQVKIRGFRVELTEIESKIREYRGITDATVVAYDDAGGGKYVAAYIVADYKVNIKDLNDFIAEGLPAYMVPAVTMQLAGIPLNQNGKVDKRALPEPEFTVAEREYAPPANKTEADICEMFKSVLGLKRVGATDNFFEIGGTSLSASKVAMKCMTGGYQIVYADIFKYPTARGLAASKGAEGAAEKNQAVRTVGYDYGRLAAALSGNDLGCIGQARRGSVGNILLTGATGFLGIHVLKEFIDNYPGKAYCFIRPGRFKELETRMKGMLMYYFGDTWEEHFGERIILLNGDITDLESVMAAGRYDFDVIVNCAANVKHFAADDTLEKINVDGVKNLIELGHATKKRLIQISTASVAGEGKNGSPPEDKKIRENELYFGQGLQNAYVNTKFMAEREILEAVGQGLDAKIMRVGNLMPRYSDGEFQINFLTNSFMQQLRGYKIIGKFPMGLMDEPAEFSPIDSTAAAVLRLCSSNQECTVFHPFNNHLIYMADIIYAMNQYGFKIDVVSDDEFQKSLLEAMKDEKMGEAISRLITYLSGDSQTRVYWFGAENKFTTEVLYRLNFKWPIISDEYLQQAIKALDGLNFFDLW
ncbi:MAG: amino acid adenylation domain-containing protein [Syntrophomonas sp.]